MMLNTLNATRRASTKIAVVSRGWISAILLAALALPLTGAAQNYPSGPLRVVVPYPPGGGTDILGRLLAQKLNEAWGQPVVVDNRPGANGTLGAAFVAKAVGDGQTMLIVPAGYAANPGLYKHLPYDQTRELAPVSRLASGPLVLVVHPSLPAKSVKELIALARARPGEINFGSAGSGSLPHLSAELFNSMSNIRMVHIPYKGAGAAVIDLLAGRVPVYFMNILQSLPLITAGQIARARGHDAGTQHDRAGNSHDRGRRPRRVRHDQLVRAAGPRLDAARSGLEAQRRGHAHTRTPRTQGAACQGRHDGGCEHARAIRRVSESRNDEIHPHHRVGRHQGHAVMPA